MISAGDSTLVQSRSYSPSQLFSTGIIWPRLVNMEPSSPSHKYRCELFPGMMLDEAASIRSRIREFREKWQAVSDQTDELRASLRGFLTEIKQLESQGEPGVKHLAASKGQGVTLEEEIKNHAEEDIGAPSILSALSSPLSSFDRKESSIDYSAPVTDEVKPKSLKVPSWKYLLHLD